MGITRRNFIKQTTIIIVGGFMATDHFTDKELQCKHCGVSKMDPTFMEILEKIRVEMNRPLFLGSAYRCSNHNQAVSSTGEHGPHTFGRAVDVAGISGADALRLVEIARKYGMTGIGLKQDSKTPHKSRFVHLDNLNSTTDKEIGFEGPRPWVWSYA
jgi:zinc D-Ala-D-Ala carboxypeptidase